MNTKELSKISKFMSFVLRHNKEEYNIAINSEGWVSVSSIIEAFKNNLTIEKIKEVVEKSEKKRFQLNEEETLIRAVQGHSNENVNITFEKKEPPEFLFHGTTTRFLESIMSVGIKKMSRQFVHLSEELSTASTVGKRHGELVILKINSKKMFNEGIEFNLSLNGVWLVKDVSPEFIEIL